VYHEVEKEGRTRTKTKRTTKTKTKMMKRKMTRKVMQRKTTHWTNQNREVECRCRFAFVHAWTPGLLALLQSASSSIECAF
jgi:hypothetical protein